MENEYVSVTLTEEQLKVMDEIDEEMRKFTEGFAYKPKEKKSKHFSIDFDSMSFTQKLDCFIQTMFPKITQEECDFIAEICAWDNDTRAAFLLAKRMFEEEE